MKSMMWCNFGVSFCVLIEEDSDDDDVDDDDVDGDDDDDDDNGDDSDNEDGGFASLFRPSSSHSCHQVNSP